MKIFSNIFSFIRGIFTELKRTDWLNLSQTMNYLLLIVFVVSLIIITIVGSDFIFVKGRTLLLNSIL
ncbi:preprotein translocase subunit SecE [bacterium]|nr:MAG: preprotein translocase subunit SecE [bacterium]